MDELIKWLLMSSFKGSILIALVLAAQMFFSRWISRRWLCCLWLVAALRLVMPFDIPSGLSVFNAMNQWMPGKSVPVPEISSKPTLDIPAVSVSAADIPIPVNESIASSAPSVSQRQPLSFWTMAFLVWLAGASILAAAVAYRSMKLSRSIRTRRLVTDSRLLELLEDCKAEMKVHIPVALVESPDVSGPVLAGFIRPRILLPSGMSRMMDARGMRFVFMHELTHLKFMDIVINWIMASIQITHWFNPLVWYAFGRARLEREEACDEHVLSRIDGNERKEYGNTIIKLLDFCPAEQDAMPCLAGIIEDKNQIERRIKMIVKFKKNNYRKGSLALLLLATISLVGLTDSSEPKKELKADEQKKESLAKQDNAWLKDYPKALEQAKTEKKMVLLNFTGSDWCGWCKKLDREVFETDVFKKYAEDNLILVKVDFPKADSQAPEIGAQNRELAFTYDVNGYPTIVILNMKGDRVGSLGYEEGGADAFIGRLNKLRTASPETRQVKTDKGNAKENPFVGKWINADPACRGITRLNIFQDDQGYWKIEEWGRGHPIESHTGPFSFDISKNGEGTAIYDHGFCISYLKIRVQGNQLELEWKTEFKDDSGRGTMKGVDKFRRLKFSPYSDNDRK